MASQELIEHIKNRFLSRPGGIQFEHPSYTGLIRVVGWSRYPSQRGWKDQPASLSNVTEPIWRCRGKNDELLFFQPSDPEIRIVLCEVAAAVDLVMEVVEDALNEMNVDLEGFDVALAHQMPDGEEEEDEG